MTPPPPISRDGLRFTALTLLLVELALLASTWGQWHTMGLLLGLHGVRLAANALLFVWGGRRPGGALDVCLLLGINMALTTAEARLLHWNLLAWLHVFLQIVFMHGQQTRENRWRHRLVLGLFLALVTGLAASDGVAASTLAGICLMAGLVYGHGEVSQARLIAALGDARSNCQQLQRMQQQLVAQEKLSCLGALAAGIAHEINNPMAFVTSNVRGLTRDLAACSQLPRALREYVDEVLPETLDGIRRVNTIVADLRRFARGDTEAPVEFDLNHEVASALRLAQGQLHDRCRLEVDLSDLPPLVGRPRQISQVLVNLLLNASQSLPEKGGVVQVRTRTERGEVCVEVQDNGVGMSQEVLNSVFLPFFTTRPAGTGTGLGLSAAYGIVTGHGGRIDVESVPTLGTSVRVHLPQNARP